MSGEIEALVDKGARSLGAAQKLFENGDYDFAVSRAYYAMFYLAEAALLLRGLSYSKHSGVISAFGRELVKGGHLDEDLHKSLYEGFMERTVGDYDVRAPYPRERADRVLARAKGFVAAVRAFIDRGGAV